MVKLNWELYQANAWCTNYDAYDYDGDIWVEENYGENYKIDGCAAFCNNRSREFMTADPIGKRCLCCYSPPETGVPPYSMDRNVYRIYPGKLQVFRIVGDVPFKFNFLSQLIVSTYFQN